MEDLEHSFESSTIQRMELTLLQALGWRLRSTTPYTFAELLLWSIDSLQPHLHQELITRVTDLLLHSLSGNFISIKSKTTPWSMYLNPPCYLQDSPSQTFLHKLPITF